MEDRIKNIEDIMKEYNEFKESLEPQITEEFENKLIDKKQSLDREEGILKAFIEELDLLDTSTMDYVEMHVTIGNYKRYIKEEQQKIEKIKKEYEELLSEKEKIENPDLTLEERRGKQSQIYEKRDSTKKRLVTEQKNIQEEIEEQELELKTIQLKKHKFKLEYEEKEQTFEERDSEGKLVTVTKKVKVATNGEEFRKLDDEANKIIDNLSNLKDAKLKCEEYIVEVDNEYQQDAKKINEAINREEKQSPVQDPPAQKPPVQEPPTQEPPVQDPPTQEPPVQDPPTQKPPVQDPPTQKPPVQDPPTQKPLVQEPPTQKPPVQDPPTPKPPVQDPPVIDELNVSIDAESGMVYCYRTENGQYYESNYSLDEAFKDKKAIKKQLSEFLKRMGGKSAAKLLKMHSKKMNPAVLKVLLEEQEIDLTEAYISAVVNGDISKLPFDKYEINLEGDYNITDKTFRQLNRYALRDNKNLGTDFKAIPWYTVKKFLSHLPGQKKLLNRWVDLLPEPSENRNPSQDSRTDNSKGIISSIKDRASFLNDLKVLPKKAYHYTSEKLNKSKLLNNVRMHGAIAGRKITGYLRRDNKLNIESDINKMKEDYQSR